MLPKKYAGDYALKETLMPNGRVRTTGVYVGPWFRFRAEPVALMRAKRALCLCAALCAAALLVPLLLVSPMLRLWYVMIPLALAVLPAVRLVRCAALVLRRERMTRRERDAHVSALAPLGAAIAALALLSLLGQLVYVLRGGAYATREGFISLSALILAGVGWRTFRLRRALAMDEVPAE